MEVSNQRHTPVALFSMEEPVVPIYGRLGAPKAVAAKRKMFAQPGIEPQSPCVWAIALLSYFITVMLTRSGVKG
jgi:hypothetical protein